MSGIEEIKVLKKWKEYKKGEKKKVVLKIIGCEGMGEVMNKSEYICIFDLGIFFGNF